MAEGIQIKNLPSTTAIKQGDTMTIVQDKQNKQLSLDVFANESDLATLSPLENRCDEVKNKIEVDEYSAEITTSQSMSKIGIDDNGTDLHENVLDGAFESCVLKGKTKYIDNDTQEILDTFQEGRNLSLIDVKSPILSNTGKNICDLRNYTLKPSYGNANPTIISATQDTLTFKPSRTDDWSGVGYKLKPNKFYSVTVKVTCNINSNYRVFFNNEGEGAKYVQVANGTEYTRIFNGSTEAFAIGGIRNSEGTAEYTIDYLSIIESPNKNNIPYEPYKSNILSFNQKDDKTIVLRSLPDGTCDTLNVETGEYVQKIGERSYQDGDTNSNNLVTDGTKTQYKLSSPIITKVDVQGFPHAYKNGHIQLSSGSTAPSLTPIVTYKVPVSRMGQIASNTKSNLRQSIKLDQLEVLVYQSLINSEYENLLVQNSAESAASFRNLSVNDPKDGLYYMLKHLIEENQPVQNMLDKINLFYLYGLLSDEHYFDLLLGGEEDVY